MNITNKLTLTHLKLNKRRTTVTIIGVVLSVAMITGVTASFFSAIDIFRQRAICENGNWNVVYTGVSAEKLKMFAIDENTKNYALTHNLGYAKLDASKNEQKPYLFIQECSATSDDIFTYEIIEGRLPKTSNELVISNEAFNEKSINHKIGDKINLDIGERLSLDKNKILDFNEQYSNEQEFLRTRLQKKYTITGIFKSRNHTGYWRPGYIAVSYLDEKELIPSDKIDVYTSLNKISSDLYDNSNKLAAKIGECEISFNIALNNSYGVSKNIYAKMLLRVAVVLMCVVICGSVSLIYNAFAISISERSRHLGMLSSVGATKSQKMNSVFFEAFILGIIGIPIGIAGGLVGIGTTFRILNPIVKSVFEVKYASLHLCVSPLMIFVIILSALLTLALSANFPARYASKITAIEAIRQENEINIGEKSAETSNLTRKLFGFEAELGLKNLKRNNKRYRATLISLTISIVLFLSTTSFLKLTLPRISKNKDCDIKIMAHYRDDVVKKQKYVFDKIHEEILKNNTNADIISKKFDGFASLDLTKKQKEIILRSGPQNLLADDKEKEREKYLKSINLKIICISDSEFKEYISKINDVYNVKLDFEVFNDTDNVNIILNGDYQKFSSDVVTMINEDNKMSVNVKYACSMEPQCVDVHGTNAFCTEKAFDKIANSNVLTYICSELKLKNISKNISAQQMVNNINKWSSEYNKKSDNICINTIDFVEYKSKIRDTNTIIYTFAYGFITLISLISVANIFNTISTNISLRKREFAVLKSVGTTTKGLNKMLNYETLLYGIKALFYGLPLSVAVMSLYVVVFYDFNFSMIEVLILELLKIIPWFHILIVVVLVFGLISMPMFYMLSKMKKENIIDVIKQENI